MKKKSDNPNAIVIAYEDKLDCNPLPNTFRIILAKSTKPFLSVDFITQLHNNDDLIIIPPNQHPFISKGCKAKFVCFEVCADDLEMSELLVFYSVMFQKQKLIKKTTKSLLNYEQITSLLKSNFTTNTTYKLLMSDLVLSSESLINSGTKKVKQNFTIAQEFIKDFRLFMDFNVDNTTISRYLGHIANNNKALLRTSQEIFKVNTRTLLKYNLFLKTIQLLGSDQNSTKNVAKNLGYSSVSAMYKMVKMHTQSTPMAIRKLIK